MNRLFVAAWPDAATIDLLGALHREDEPGVRRVPDRNLHVTLRFLGDADPDAAAARLNAAALPAAVVTLGPAVERLGDRQIAVPVDGADRLAAAVRTATATLGVDDRRRFRGHLTIARVKPRSVSALLGSSITGGFTIHIVSLVASELSPDGATYSTLATFPTMSLDEPPAPTADHPVGDPRRSGATTRRDRRSR